MVLTNPQYDKLILINDSSLRVEFDVTGETLNTTGVSLDTPLPVTRGLISWWKMEEGTTGAGDIKDTALSATGTGAIPNLDESEN